MKSIWISLKQNDEKIQTIHITAFYKIVFLRTDYMGENEVFYSIWDLPQFNSILQSHLLDEKLTFNNFDLSIDDIEIKEKFNINEKNEENIKQPLHPIIESVAKWFGDKSPDNIIPAIRITWTQTNPSEVRSVFIFPWPQYYGYQQLVNGLAEFVISSSQDNKSFFVKDIHKLETDYYKSIKGQLSMRSFLPGEFSIDLIDPSALKEQQGIMSAEPRERIGELSWEAREYGDDHNRNCLHNYHQTGMAADWASQEFENLMEEFTRLFNKDIPFIKDNPAPKREEDDYEPINLSLFKSAIRVEVGYEKVFSIVADGKGFIIDTNFKLIKAADYNELITILKSKYFNDDTIGITRPEKINTEVLSNGEISYEDRYPIFHDDFFEFCEEHEHDNEKCGIELSRMIQESFELVKGIIKDNL